MNEDDEDVIALRAVEAWLEVDGDDDLSDAAREALAAIADEALARKEARIRREEAARREEARRDAERRAERRAERKREDARSRAERWDAERRARDARLAAVERAHARLASEHPAPPKVAPRVRLEVPPVPARPTAPPPAARTAPAPRLPTVAPPRVDVRPRANPVDEPTAVPDEIVRGLAREAVATTPADATPEEPVTVSEEPDRFLCENVTSTLVGADLVAWRTLHGLTQQAAADRLRVRQGTVSKAESRRDTALGPALRDALARLLASERTAGPA